MPKQTYHSRSHLLIITFVSALEYVLCTTHQLDSVCSNFTNAFTLSRGEQINYNNHYMHNTYSNNGKLAKIVQTLYNEFEVAHLVARRVDVELSIHVDACILSVGPQIYIRNENRLSSLKLMRSECGVRSS